MTSERDDSRLVEYLYGELSADEARAYERSLADDPQASADARALASVLSLAREADAPVEPPAFLDAKIMAAARAQVEAQAETARSRGWRRWLTGSSVGGALVAVAASALVVLNLDLLEPRTAEPTAAARAPSPQLERSNDVVAKREAPPVDEPPPPATTAAAPIAPAKETQEAVADAQRELRRLELRGALAKDADRAEEGGGGVGGSGVGGGGVGGLGASRTRGAGSAGGADKRAPIREEAAAAELESPDPDARPTGARRQASADPYAGVDAPAEAPAERAKSKQLSLAADEASKGELDDVSGAVAEKKAATSKSDAAASVASARDDDGAVGAAGPAPARRPAPAAQAAAPAAPPAPEASVGDALAPKGSADSGRASAAGGKAGEVDPAAVRAAVAVVLSNAEARIRAGDLTGARRELLEGRSRWGTQPAAAVLSLRLARLAEQQGQAAEARRWAQEALARTQDDGVRREANALLSRVR